jgi:hypothetical protein
MQSNILLCVVTLSLFMLNVVRLTVCLRYAENLYAEFDYAECLYAECR